jgi:hypothetical protein
MAIFERVKQHDVMMELIRCHPIFVPSRFVYPSEFHTFLNDAQARRAVD